MTAVAYDDGDGREAGDDGVYKTVGTVSVGAPSGPAEGVDVDAVIKAIQRPFQGLGDGESGGWLPVMQLPGFGSEREDCGDDMAHFCADCGHVSIYGRTCRQSKCPRCASAWARKQATAVSAKLDALRRYRYTVEVDKGDAERMVYHHLIISPPHEWALEHGDPLEQTFDVVGDVLDELDCQGTVFYHPWRGEEGDDRGAWKKRLFHGRDWEDSVKPELKASPHFHAVVAAEHVPGAGLVERLHEETGWVINRVTKENSSVSIGNDADLAAVVAYCLSHVGLYETDQGTTRAAYRHLGADMNRVTASEEQTERIDALVRAVAPKVLNLPYNSLTCLDERTDGPADVQVDVNQAAASRTDWLDNWDGAVGEGDGLQEATADVAVADPAEPELAETTTCKGRMLHIAKAPRYLEDDEWCAAAPKADDLADAWREWRHELGFIDDKDGPPDEDPAL